MQLTRYMKRGDMEPELRLRVDTSGADSPIDPSALDAVALRFTDEAGAIVIDDFATIENADGTGFDLVRAWQSGDTDTVGTYSIEYELQYTAPTPSPRSIPPKGYFQLVIDERLS